MLVCPHCQFENPDQNRFCQKCGTSLTERPCPVCDSVVPLSVQQCPQCGASTATRWRALLLPSPHRTTEGVSEETSITPATKDALAVGSEPDPQFLDTNCRYQLVEALPPAIAEAGASVSVIDCQPLSPSALERLDPLWEQLFPAEQARIVRSLVERVVVGPGGADVRLRLDGLGSLVRDLTAIRPDTLRAVA